MAILLPFSLRFLRLWLSSIVAGALTTYSIVLSQGNVNSNEHTYPSPLVSPYAVLFSWHSFDGLSLGDESGSQLLVAVNSLRETHRSTSDLPIFLVTNIDINSKATTAAYSKSRLQVNAGIDWSNLNRSLSDAGVQVRVIDLMEESGLQREYTRILSQEREDTGRFDSNSTDKKSIAFRIACATKIQALLSGWADIDEGSTARTKGSLEGGVGGRGGKDDPRFLPEMVLYMDIDTIVLQDDSLYNMFEPLTHYDITGVMEGYSIGPRPTPAVGGGFEINTGCFAVRRKARPLLTAWLDTFRSDVDRYLTYSGVDQQALMVALQENPQYRFLSMPSIFNFRRATLYPLSGPSLPAVLHSKLIRDLNFDLDIIRPGKTFDSSIVGSLSYSGSELLIGQISAKLKKIFEESYMHLILSIQEEFDETES